MHTPIQRVLLAALATFAIVAPAFSQALTGAITGRALDSSSAVLPGVEVAVSSPAMMGYRTTFTDLQGAYRVTQLPSGDYRVTFKLTGVKTLNVTR